MTAAGNNTVIIHSTLTLTDRNIESIAGVIRDQIRRAREPENLRCIVGLSSELRDNATDAGHVFWWLPYDDAVGINNLYKFSIHDQHFGYAGRTRFYMYGSWERYLRIWPANPVRLPDGTWKAYPGGVDINFRVKHAQRDAVIKTIQEDLEHMSHGSES